MIFVNAFTCTWNVLAMHCSSLPSTPPWQMYNHSSASSLNFFRTSSSVNVLGPTVMLDPLFSPTSPQYPAYGSAMFLRPWPVTCVQPVSSEQDFPSGATDRKSVV